MSKGARVRGTVRWFNEKKGFGFLARDDGGKDTFLHFSGIDMAGYKSLQEGDHVEFEIVEGAKGPQANACKKIS